MAKNIVTVIRKEGVILGLFTNNLAAWETLEKMIPQDDKKEMYSYSQMNRKVKEPGNSMLVPTSIGTYQIQKLILHRKSY